MVLVVVVVLVAKMGDTAAIRIRLSITISDSILLSVLLLPLHHLNLIQVPLHAMDPVVIHYWSRLRFTVLATYKQWLITYDFLVMR